MTVRVRRPDGSWVEFPAGRVDFLEQGGELKVQTEDEPVFFAPDAWTAFEVVGEQDPVLVVGDEEERIFPEGF